jgi:hypothetical protein
MGAPFLISAVWLSNYTRQMSNTPEQPPVTLEPPIWMLHLTGGIALLVGSNRVCMLISPGGPGLSFFSLLSNVPILSLFKNQERVKILGYTQFASAQEMNDSITSNFVIAGPNVANQCPALSQFHHWSGVANALHEMNRGSDALLASRTSTQIRHCVMRLERLSSAYRTVLMSAKPAEPSIIQYTSDKYAEFLGSEYRSLLNELYSLRDALLVAVYRLYYKRSDPFTLKKLKALAMNEKTGIGTLISNSMFSDAGDLLIDHMSLYRSIAQHCIGTPNPIFGDMYRLVNSSGPYGELPFVVYPLYDDIEHMRSIERGSSKGILGRPSKVEAERFLSIPSHLDALEFCHDCFLRLLEMSQMLASVVEVQPKAIILTEKDILEATLTDGHGKTKRVKRDDATGQLVEY